VYKISIPASAANKNVNKEELYKILIEAGATRMFWSMGIISLKKEKLQAELDFLREVVPYFQERGIEVGIWFWTFWRNELTEEYLEDCMQVKFSGAKRIVETTLKNNSGFCCPASKRFVDEAMEVITAIAEINPDIMMFDDDYRFGNLGGYSGCYCKHHIKMVSEKLGRVITREELYEKVYEGKPNAERNAFIEALGESMENFAIRVRETVNKVNPQIRFALCSVLSLWDNDGTDSIKIAKLLAGDTKPLIRLIGAPYWAKDEGWRVSLNNVVELERMETGWIGDEDIEIMTEGDVCPTSCQRVPAAYLECFDTILRAADVGDGILKYMYDYASFLGYDNGYVRRHLANKDMYVALERVFGDKKVTGVRVYEAMKKFAYADFEGVKEPDRYVEDLFQTRAGRVLSDNAVPTIYSGNDGVGIAFGENARNLPAEALENGLILDIRAAKILTEQGIDVGIESIGENMLNDRLYYPEFNEYIKTNYTPNSAYKLSAKEGARVVTYSTNDGKELFVDSFLYENEQGGRFLILGFDAAYTEFNSYRTYCMQRMLYSACEWLGGKKLPAKCQGNPGIYILTKKDADGNMAVGVWNIFEDETLSTVVELDGEYSSAEIIGANGRLEGDKVIIENLPAFKFCFINLKKDR